MGEEALELEMQIERERNHLGSTVDELEARARKTLDWRDQFRKNTEVGLIVAFGAGVVASMMAGSSSRGYVVAGRDRALRVETESNPVVVAARTFLLSFLAREARKIVSRRSADPARA